MYIYVWVHKFTHAVPEHLNFAYATNKLLLFFSRPSFMTWFLQNAFSVVTSWSGQECRHAFIIILSAMITFYCSFRLSIYIIYSDRSLHCNTNYQTVFSHYSSFRMKLWSLTFIILKMLVLVCNHRYTYLHVRREGNMHVHMGVLEYVNCAYLQMPYYFLCSFCLLQMHRQTICGRRKVEHHCFWVGVKTFLFFPIS